MKIKLLSLLLCMSMASFAQKTENVIIVTLDGLRWQEVFQGADSELLNDEKYTESIKKTTETFWADDATQRREMLMPFLWSTVKNEGIIIGNRNLGSKIDIKNPYAFSYPGYNEILTGYPDKKVNSNDKINNENVTVLEFLNKKPAFKGKVAAFSTWDVFPYIINEERSGIYVNTARDLSEVTHTKTEALLNDMEQTVPSLASSRHDYLTFYHAFDYLETKKPKVLYLAFDETDEFAHEGKYREYLYAANTIDTYISKLWEFCQNDPQYKNKTTIIIATDHGRGDAIKSQWTSHGEDIKDGRSIWMAAMGPDTPSNGEIDFEHQNHQNEIAATVAKLLGQKFENGHEIGKPIELIIK
ncbi:alkaline phosphatase family protein [Arcticibacterium luteifluviistationis]|uniref:Phosphoglyceromutase n=1 Tax=Arcticibacterium luteifluviistationis TaxID=1784714 RepID=A0A2Z4GHF6_9BACT|nr:alkaline phosphatase family protein [Arcticibacterium luteifluviistationis]AWW00359.1 phosphoglyceromutase [Arcticibacterium luteifluviistationis]